GGVGREAARDPLAPGRLDDALSLGHQRSVLPEGGPDRDRRGGGDPLRAPEPDGDGPPVPPARALVPRPGQAQGTEPDRSRPEGHDQRPVQERGGDPVAGGQPPPVGLPLPPPNAPRDPPGTRP